MTKLPPRKPGFYLFKGDRHIRNATFERIHEPIEVVEHVSRGKTELAVLMTGRHMRIPLACFEGEWTHIDLEAA